VHFRGLIPLFEKILVPLDGSEYSVRALENAVQIAKKFNGKITLIHVYSVSACRHAGINFDKCVQAIRKVGAGLLADGEKRVKAEGVQIETLLREGHIVEEILKAAREGEFHLIIMGARGISRIKEILMGSVSDGVTRHAPCPVLLVK
jgi:nucleotide-binding universal stress UspA family protein